MTLQIRGVPIDLGLAVQRLKRDMRDDWYPDAIQYADLLDVDRLKRHFESFASSYTPSPSEQFNIPKPGFMLRYSLEPSLIDRLLYQALADNLIKVFDPLLNDRVFSFRSAKGRDNYIFRPGVAAWLDFVGTIKAELNGTTKVLLTTDVQNFFECITIGDLKKNLLDFAPSQTKSCLDAISLAHDILTKWTPYKYYGIPQNRDASSFFGNAFLHPVDEAMTTLGYNYFRYMDDVRIVCDDIYHARRALRDLIIELRHLRLNVNSKKTSIVAQGDEKMGAVLPPSNRLLEQIDSMWRTNKLAQIRRALPMLQQYTLSLIHNRQTDDAAFRFCIHRLQNVARCDELEFDFSGITDAVLEQLAAQPWSTDMFVRYLQVVNLEDHHVAAVISLLEDPQRHIYEWQGFHLWNLLGAKNARDKHLRHLASKTMKEATLAPLKAGSILYLGACGTATDRSSIAHGFATHGSAFVRRAAVIATQQVAASDASKYVEPHLNGELSEARDVLKKRGRSPQYYVPPYKLSPSELFKDLPNIYTL